MTLALLRRFLLIAALALLPCLPAAAQEVEPPAEETPVPPPSPHADDAAQSPTETTPTPAGAEAAAGPLIDAGRFEEAIVALRPLLDQESIEPNALFLYGLASLEASQRPGRPDEERETLLDEAIAAFHVMLVQRPDLVRVRLELARAFYLKGEDRLAQRHFEQVLAGGVPDEVAANVNLFLGEIRSRGRWSFNVGFALAPDSNIGGGSEERTIYINVFGQPLPFERDAEQLTSSGIGASVWGGAEYQVPIAERLRLRAGGSAARREYEGSQFDQLSLATISAHAGWWTRRRRGACWRARGSAGSAPCRTIASSARAWSWRAGSPAGVLHAQRAIARAEAVVTMIAVVPGALQPQGAEGGGEGLVPAPGEARLAAALAGQVGSPLVGPVGVEPPSDGLPHDLQRHTSGFNLNHLEVDVIERTSPISRSTSVSISCAIAEWRPPFFPLRSACSRPAAHRRSGR